MFPRSFATRLLRSAQRGGWTIFISSSKGSSATGTTCGVDAPGLELVSDRVGRVLSPAQLADGAVERRWLTSRRTQPTLVAGDALVFSGDVLHRTHLSASMTHTRTSIELRCFAADAIPDRIAHDEFVAVPGPHVSPVARSRRERDSAFGRIGQPRKPT